MSRLDGVMVQRLRPRTYDRQVAASNPGQALLSKQYHVEKPGKLQHVIGEVWTAVHNTESRLTASIRSYNELSAAVIPV